jgi:hypothetical protein
MGFIAFRPLSLIALSAVPLLAFTACDVVQNGSGASIPDQTTVPEVGASATVTTALFDPTSEAFDAFLAGSAAQPLPLPSDLLFAGTTDGTLNIPISDPSSPVAGPVTAANTLDGFSTVAPITIPFSGDIDTTTLDGHLLVIDVTAPGGVPGAHFGEPVTVLRAFDTVTHSLTLTPAQPLRDASQYLVVLHGALLDGSAAQVLDSTTFFFTKATEPLFVGDPSDPTIQSSLLQTEVNAGALSTEDIVNLEALRSAYQAIYGLLETTLPGVGALPAAIPRDDVIVAFTYTTQTVTAQLSALRTAVDGLPEGPGAGGLTVSAVFPPAALAGLLPDVSSLGAIVTGTFESADFRSNPVTGSFLTADGNASLTTALGTSQPVAQGTSDLQFTLFLPANEPAPVVVFQHGITADRSSSFAVANTLASIGFATIAMDLPLHGSRTPDPVDDAGVPVDLMMQIAPGVEVVPLVVSAANSGVSDSGPFINLLSLPTTRDSVRQSWADLWQLVAAIQESDTVDVNVVDPLNPLGWSSDGTPDLATGTIVFAGHSLGAIVGAGFLAGEPDVTIGLLSAGGSVVTDLLHNSPTFGPVIDQGLSDASGGIVVPGTAAYSLFFLLAQTIIDAADPANVAGGVAQQVLLQEGIGDAVIPNGNTELLAAHLGLPLLDPVAQNLFGLPTVETGTGYAGSGLFQFGTTDVPVGHAFLLRPEDTLPDMTVVANPVAEAQAQMATYFGTYLATLPDGVGTIIDPFAAAP